MSRVRYSVAMSLDGFIAGPNGEADWIVLDPEFDFAELWEHLTSDSIQSLRTPSR